MKTTEIIPTFTSLILQGESLEKILSTRTEQEIIAIIIGVNEGEKYWAEEKRRMRNPQPNMAPQKAPSYGMYTFDEYREGQLFEPFANFLLKAAVKFPYLVLYVHEGEFGFSPVFGVRHLNKEFENPYLIKFKETHFPKTLYREMITILYSKENTKKYLLSGLEKVRSLESYEY